MEKLLPNKLLEFGEIVIIFHQFGEGLRLTRFLLGNLLEKTN